MSRLPTVPIASDGEAIDGYLDRVAHLYGAPIGGLHVALHHATRQPALPLSWAQIRWLDEFEDEIGLGRGLRILTLTGKLPRMFPAIEAATSPMDLARAAAHDWVFLAGSRYCPACLRNGGVWKLEWRIPLAVACLDHELLLHDSCPGCGGWPRSFKGGQAPSNIFAGRRRDPWICAQPARADQRRTGRAAEPCGQDLRLAPDTPADLFALRLQGLVQTILSLGAVNIAGRTFLGGAALSALRELYVIADRLRRGDEHRPGRRIWRTPPRQTNDVVDHLLLVQPVIRAQSLPVAAAALNRLARQHRCALDLKWFEDILPADPALTDLIDTTLTSVGRPTSRLRRACSFGQGTILEVEPAKIPQRFWACAVPDEVRHTMPARLGAQAEAVLSLSVAWIATRYWPSAAAALNLPAAAARWSRQLRPQMTRPARDALTNAAFSRSLDLAQLRGGLPDQPRHIIRTAKDLRDIPAAACYQGLPWCNPTAGSCTRTSEPAGKTTTGRHP